MSKKEAWQKGIEWLSEMGLNQPAVRMTQYPHEISGGMKQRVVIAMALACSPSLIIADEPTTALDPTVQKQILELLQKKQKAQASSLLLITHDLSLAAFYCDRLLVMHAGRIVETGTAGQVLQHPCHPYTQALVRSKRSLMKKTSDGVSHEPIHKFPN
jgi:ABC-type dipeptide/oligopeptide/nickel transport system ATPase component